MAQISQAWARPAQIADVQIHERKKCYSEPLSFGNFIQEKLINTNIIPNCVHTEVKGHNLYSLWIAFS